MKNTEYNGWTNYATWRINLEMFDNALDQFGDIMHQELYDIKTVLKLYAEEIIEQTSEGLAQDYALAFLQNVNWYEIVRHLQDEWLLYHCASCYEETEDDYCTGCKEDQEALV